MSRLKTFYLVAVLLILLFVFSFYFSKKPSVEEYDKKKITNLEEELNFIKKNLVSGGPPKDGIPSIDNPKYISSKEAKLKDSDIVFGVSYGGFVAAYPKKIMYWHEIVNEEVNGEKISVTYCPLTESVIGYIGYELGVSGELYNSNLVMYDRKTDARIPQILGMGIEGDLKGKRLETFEVTVTQWKNWKKEHPDTLVLSRDTGFSRNYNRNPYPGYDSILRIWFPVTAKSDKLKTKEIVLGIEKNGEFLAVKKDGFKLKYPNGLNISIGGENIRVIYDDRFNQLRVEDSSVKNFEVYWFAWYAYHPETRLIK